MLIYTRKGSKNIQQPKVIEEKPAIVKEENKVLDNEIIQKPKRKKSTLIAVEEPILVEEKTEDEDLSKWLEEHTED